jgi:hypothetical protein
MLEIVCKKSQMIYIMMVSVIEQENFRINITKKIIESNMCRMLRMLCMLCMKYIALEGHSLWDKEM